ncbi:NUF2 [Symbiodinium natans]|uniref:Protein phosphatase n=1 Tax=Symbiodinium natans TaxID=878477 RepID=A0A812J975_9DINO|nr:NUF2 [Symbiodinium natans]
MESMKRSPTFLVGTVQQKDILGEFQKREQHYTEEYSKNKPLCFSARAFQQPHPAKVRMGYKDADATLTSPMLLGVCDGVSQLEEFQMDPSLLPNELLRTCEELAMLQLMPDTNIAPQDQYRGPISLLKEAYQETTSYGSTTVLLAALDNSTRIHGKLHPMIAVLSIGDCELLMLRRTNGRQSELEAVFHTEMQRIDYNVQTPLQLARVDERIDEDPFRIPFPSILGEADNMLKGFAFKILAPKDITGVLNMIGVHPAVAADNIDRPSADNAMAFFNALAEFAYDMDSQQVKAQMPAVTAPEIYDEAMDFLTIFKLSRQLAMINLVDDFNFKDFWEPIPKRFRALLSGMINFCRYKEAKVVVITGMKEDVQALDSNRLEMVDKLNQVDAELGAAQERHNAELQDMWNAENEAAEAKATNDKLTRQRSSADRVVEDAEKKRASVKERVRQGEQRIEQLREQVNALQSQIAESPEGLEKEIEELKSGVCQLKAVLEDKANQRRAHSQRDQVFCRLLRHLECYKDELNRVGNVASNADTAKQRAATAREELGLLRQSLEAVKQDGAELEQSLKSIVVDNERAKQVHAERMEQLEVRRQAALQQHQELQAKRTEEQRQLHQLQSQRLELEAEVAAVRRAHAAEMGELRVMWKAVLDKAESYNLSLEALFHEHSHGDDLI